MISVLGGGLEYALIRRITEEFDPTRLATKHEYYRSIQRRQPERLYSRAAAILAISDVSHLPSIDWAPQMGAHGQAPTGPLLGWELSARSEMWEPGWKAFVESAYDSGAFSAEVLATLTAVEQVSGRVDDAKLKRDFAVHHLMRLLLQLEAAEEDGTALFLPHWDQRILEELGTFALWQSAPPPFDLPDFSPTLRDPEGRSVSLLSFEPPDIPSMIAVRADKDVRRYAQHVQKLWDIADPIEREREAVRAMRQVVEADDARAQVSRVFEALGWLLKPLGWGGVPGAGLLADGRDLASNGFERRRVSKDWLLIRPRMTDIATRDYLRRTGNYYGGPFRSN